MLREYGFFLSSFLSNPGLERIEKVCQRTMLPSTNPGKAGTANNCLEEVIYAQIRPRGTVRFLHHPDLNSPLLHIHIKPLVSKITLLMWATQCQLTKFGASYNFKVPTLKNPNFRCRQSAVNRLLLNLFKIGSLHVLKYCRSCSVTSTLPLLVLQAHHLKLHYHVASAPPSRSCWLLLCSCKDFPAVKQIHASLIVSNALQSNSFASELMTSYARFSDLDSALGVFKTLEAEPTTMLWNLIIRFHVDSGLFHSALLLYKKMREVSVDHDAFTFPIINRALSSIRSDVNGKMIHCLAIKMGLDQDIYFCNTLIDVYVKRGCLGCARNLFETMSHRDLVSWTSMIAGYISESHLTMVSDLFNRMRTELEPNSVTLIVMLQAFCASRTSIEGAQVHGYAVKSGLLMDWSVQNAVFSMYANVGNTEDVETVFSETDKKDMVPWNILVSFYSMKGDIMKVACIFKEMQSGGLCSRNIETLTLVISALGKSGSLQEGESVHCLVIKTGLSDDILLTSLLDFYAKCGRLEISVQLFRQIHYKSNITWAAMMSSFVQNGYSMQAVLLFQQMQAEDLDPGLEIWRSLIDAYASLGALKLGKGVHGYFIKNVLNGADDNVARLETSILNMYARGGSIPSAAAYFDRILVKDVVAWTTMIEGFGSHGFGFEALKYFDLMVEQRVHPNSVTFLSLLSACSHSGLVSEGCRIYCSMKWSYSIEPALDHHTCIVDLLGRYGMLKEALVLILKMIILPDSRIWGSLLAAARVNGNEKLGEYAAHRVLELESDNAGYYTLLSNVKASVGRWDEVEELRKVMSEKDFKKKPGWSCIEVKGVIQGFVSGDRSHPDAEEIHGMLGYLSRAT